MSTEDFNSRTKQWHGHCYRNYISVIIIFMNCVETAKSSNFSAYRIAFAIQNVTKKFKWDQLHRSALNIGKTIRDFKIHRPDSAYTVITER